VKFKTKVIIALALPILVNVAMAAGIFWSTTRSSYLVVRAQHAHLTLAGFRQLKFDVETYIRSETENLLLTQLGSPLPLASRAAVDQALASVRRAIALEVATVQTQERESEADELAVLADMERRFTRIYDLATQIRSAVAQGRLDEFNQLFERSRSERDGLVALLVRSVAEEIEETEEADREAAGLATQLRISTLVAEGLVLLMGIALAVWLALQLRARLGALARGAEALAAGRLSHRVDLVGHDEFDDLARNVNRMAAELEEKHGALREVHESLEATVAQRTEQLREAHGQLEQADRVRRRFFADISHELRTPLTVIRGEAEVALRGKTKSDEEHRIVLQRVIEQTSSLTRLVDDLLLIARTENGATTMRRQAVALIVVVQEACRDASHAAARKGIVIDVNSHVRDAVVLGDRGRLRQLFLILLDNAVHYSRRDARIAVNILSATGGITVQVIDHGIGIPGEEIAHVFDRFYRASNALDQRIDGTGLGLPIAKAIVEGHGGQICVDSELDQGTTIAVTLPALNELKAIA
jgi:two-component system, OmpR family, sensor kinase